MTVAAAAAGVDPLQLPPGPPVRTETVHFYSDGWRLQGLLVTPGGPCLSGATPPLVPRLAVVCSHGWSGAVNFRALPLADRLARAGYLTLVLDHRGFGGSEGPRARCEPHEQVRDMSAVATYLAERPDVDAAALGAIGASFSGAIALAAAAANERFAACVAIVPLGSGRRWLWELHGEAGWAALTEQLTADETARVLTGAGQRVAMPTLMPLPPSPAGEAEAALMAGAHPAGYPLENAALALDFAPEEMAAREANVRCLGKGRKERYTPLEPSTVAALRDWLAERGTSPDIPLFCTRQGRPLSPDATAIQARLTKYHAIAAGNCPSLTAKKIPPHTLRHYVDGRVMWPEAASPLVAEPRGLVPAT